MVEAAAQAMLRQEKTMSTASSLSLDGRVAIVTGASRGIGRAIALELAQRGAAVLINYNRSPQAAEEVAHQIEQSGGRALCVQADVSDFQQAQGLVKAAIDGLGGLDILVNNAGITRDTLMLRMSEEQWDEVIRTNLKSVFNLTKHALRPMLKNRGGSIINMSSVVGVFGNAGQANYAASKAGIFGFTKSIAKEVGSRNIRCNAIAPGFIETEMTGELDEKTREAFLAGIPMKRLGSGDEVADACLFLGSDLSSYISGQTLSVCGALNC